MLRIVTHIESLLLEHDCVILPGFGGFVLQTVPATFDEKSHHFLPMRKEVMFNTTLRHTDGLLCGSYMRRYEVDYAKARLMLDEDIESLTTLLEQEKNVSLGCLGSFVKGDEGQVIFKPVDSALVNADAYGLPEFDFPILPVIERETGGAIAPKDDRGDVFYIPISRRFVRVAVASAAAIALFFLVSTPVKDVNPATYRASFVPSEMMSYSFEAPVNNQILAVEPMVADSDNLVEEKAEEKESVEVSNETVSDKKAVEPIKEKSSVNGKKMYHVIIASFPNGKQADEYMDGIDRKLCRNANMVVKGGKFRVYADKFDNRAAAESYMATIRKNPKYKDAWLFVSR